MLFKPPKRHRPPSIIIVALVDVLLVVLIFMMVSTTFKTPEQPALKLALPESTQTNRVVATESERLIVTVDRQAPFLYLGERPVTYERLREELRRLAELDPAASVSLRADEAAPIGQILRVMDAARENGIQTANIFTRTPGSSP
jgi:biopolymer transport protein ExbD